MLGRVSTRDPKRATARPPARIQLKPGNLEAAFAQALTTHYADPAK
jgi:hypothetical protein